MKKIEFGVFFSKHLWLGLLWLLFSIILNKYFGQSDFAFYITIKVIESISIAIIVASIFTYTLGTGEFIGKIKDLLEDIVVSRDFLENLSKEGKEEALKSLLKPSDIEQKSYINIGRYYDDYVKDSLSVGNKNVRSNYSISGTAFYNEEKCKVGLRGVYSYRLYPSDTGYRDIVIGFDEEDTDSVCERIVVNRPDGKREVHENIDLEQIEVAGAIDRQGKIDINTYGNGFDHLDIEVHVVEYGYDHWFMFTFKALQPTDGFRLHIQCGNGLEIRKHAVFDTGNAYHTDTRGKSEININCNQWITEGVGVSILISYPHNLNCTENKPNKKINSDHK